MSYQNWIITSLMLIGSLGFAQTLKRESLGIQGSTHLVFANAKSYYIQESIGQQSVIRTYNANNYSLRQGFLQPLDVSLISEHLDTHLLGFFYPNPFVDHVNVQFQEPIIDVITVTVHDILGRLVYDKTFQPMQSLIINFGDLSSGSYLFRLQMRTELLVAKLVRR
ncbi:T9SS type A sorting domain-containing protein [Psychroserpens sp. SPM9]|uniref:T9SS type A sorting domain-containing protein n=1 Tax=Psychroserpens sp. SPM9 TaxID=2975598 RepID=UPI0021A347D7|nr:T9SS type A sorting domain-containing protein [Psychroserpens sp. SPM9]MDG5492028.1 T9SS type A sorting domain-containing protein [Psychroserpens sp. SPM9]